MRVYIPTSCLHLSAQPASIFPACIKLYQYVDHLVRIRIAIASSLFTDWVLPRCDTNWQSCSQTESFRSKFADNGKSNRGVFRLNAIPCSARSDWRLQAASIIHLAVPFTFPIITRQSHSSSDVAHTTTLLGVKHTRSYRGCRGWSSSNI